MKGVAKYQVICANCKRSDEVGLIGETLIWEGNKHIISGRHRLDGEWGFQCGACGNDDLLTDQEKEEIADLQSPDPKDIEKVVSGLRPQKPRFTMVKL